jgi:uncharacterized protein (DUF433 family)
MPVLSLEPIAVPLRQDATGAVRVGKSRVLLELVIRAFRDGATPEAIVQAYDTLELSDVYAVLAYYLAHREEVEGYLRRCAEEADALRCEIESAQPRRLDLRERLLARSDAMAKAKEKEESGRASPAE